MILQYMLVVLQVCILLPSQSLEMPRRRMAIVTGGTRGIGLGIAQRLAPQCSVLILTYNTDKTRAEQVAQELQKEPYSVDVVEIVGGDMSLESTRDRLFEVVDEKLEKDGCELAVVVHNAGQLLGISSDNAEDLEAGAPQYGDGSLLQANGKVDFSQSRYYQRLYGEAWVDLCERSLARMRQQVDEKGKFRGSLIGISSPGCNHLQQAYPLYSMPGSGKTLMEYSMRIYARNVAAMGVNCNVVIPSIVRTEAYQRYSIWQGMEKDELLETFAKRILMGKVMDPTDIGDLVAFLSHPTGGGRFITGQSIKIDAGGAK